MWGHSGKTAVAKSKPRGNHPPSVAVLSNSNVHSACATHIVSGNRHQVRTGCRHEAARGHSTAALCFQGACRLKAARLPVQMATKSEAISAVLIPRGELKSHWEFHAGMPLLGTPTLRIAPRRQGGFMSTDASEWVRFRSGPTLSVSCRNQGRSRALHVQWGTSQSRRTRRRHLNQQHNSDWVAGGIGPNWRTGCVREVD